MELGNQNSKKGFILSTEEMLRDVKQCKGDIKEC